VDCIKVYLMAHPEAEMKEGEPITEDMPTEEQKERARRWVRRQPHQGSTPIRPPLREQHFLEAPSESDLAETPTQRLKTLKARFEAREQKAGAVWEVLSEVEKRTEKKPVGLERRREAVRDLHRNGRRGRKKIEEEIERRSAHEQDLSEALDRMEELARMQETEGQGSEPQRPGRQDPTRTNRVRAARALLRASRARRALMDEAGTAERTGSTDRTESTGERGARDIGTIDARMKAKGLEGPLEAVQTWQDGSRPDVGEGGDAALEAARAIARAHRAATEESDRSASDQEHFLDKARAALGRLTEEERDLVREELTRRGEAEYRQAKRAAQRDRTVHEARDALVQDLTRAEEKRTAGQEVGRARALDQAQERFEALEGELKGRVRKGLDPDRLRQLEEALRADRSSAEEIQARKRRQHESRPDQRQNQQSQGQDNRQDQDPGRERSRGGRR
jgi:hypothetical protein